VNLANWLAQVLQPRLVVDFLDFEEDGKSFAILVIDPAYRAVQRSIPVSTHVESLKPQLG
jgi:hypothetical protein